MEHGDSFPTAITFPHPHPPQKSKRSASAPTMAALHRYTDFGSDAARVEAKFLNFGDHIALYSENEGNQGFVSTLG